MQKKPANVDLFRPLGPARARAHTSVVAAMALATTVGFATPARADAADDDDPRDFDTERYEPAGFPLIAGDSDIGLELGAVGTLTRFAHGVQPYLWNLDVLLAASFKDGPHAIEVAQQSYLVDIDLPGVSGGLYRLHPQLSFTRTINQGYFGLGNASSAQRPAFELGEPRRYFQYLASEVEAREITRIRIAAPWYAVVTTTFRHEEPEAYQGSKLASDASVVRGLGRLSLLTLGGGGVYDTRDNEHFTRRGSYHQVGLKYVQGLPWDTEVRYGQAGGFFAGYLPIAGPALYAARLVLDFQFGNVPFFDLARAGPFEAYDMLGGSTGVRGVPVGRYSGPIKVLANQELRAMLVGFRLLGQRFRLGADVLFDIGRIFSDYTFAPANDGRGVGLKWGAGCGLYLQWGQAAVFRIEAAYSPDAVAENPKFPVGLYVNDGISF